ncbi:hypothetical protein EC957_012454 [Mortierella hygrophila]|uniref:Uncharacterized protein n=1 Tax=Mortierella hygrophila TaxID=979708 RepID=A0A9P6K333_9FUNG|nr:hypothetical protein EC957_012454 [Mortierella hygrophila]
MSTLMHRYKALPQTTKNYIQLGVLVAALGGFYYRDPIKNKFHPAERTVMGSVNSDKK